MGHPWAPLSIQKLGGNTSTGGLLRDFGMRSSPGNASHHCPRTRMGTSVLLQRGAGRGHQVGALLSHGSGSPRGLGTRRGLCSHGSEALPRSRWSDTGGASRPSVNYLASMFINQQFLCKQTHPEPPLPVTLATAPSRPWLGMCSGLPPGPQPRLQLFACSLLLLQGVFRPLHLPSVGSWASLLWGLGPPHHCPLGLWIVGSWTFPSLNPGLPHNLILAVSVAGSWTSQSWDPGPLQHWILDLPIIKSWISLSLNPGVLHY